jgi:hypothetical protein
MEAALKQMDTALIADRIKPFCASVDALRWLNHQTAHSRAKLWKDPPSRYFIGRAITNNFMSLTYNKDGMWVLAARDMPAMAWFPVIPWTRCILQEQKDRKHTLSLLCAPQELEPVPELNFPGGMISGFSIDFCIPSRVASIFVDDDVIRTGLFQPRKSAHANVELTHTSEPMPLVHKGLSTKRKGVK